MFTQESHVSITSPAPFDKHSVHLYVQPSVTCFHYIPIPLWQTQLWLVCSLKCHMFPLYPQLPVTNTAAACMFNQVSHVPIISPAPCDKHNFRLYAHLSVTCFHYIPSPLWQTQLPPVCSTMCHMLTYMLHWFSSCNCEEYSWNTAHVALNNSQSIIQKTIVVWV